MAKRGRKRQASIDWPKIGANGGAIVEENRRALSGYVAEVERINGQVDELKKEAAEIYKAAGEANFDVKAIRTIVRERKVDKTKRQAFEAVCDAYRQALGMLADTPLGRAAAKRDGMEPPAAPFQPPDTSDAPFRPPADVPFHESDVPFHDDDMRVADDEMPEPPAVPA